MAFLAGGVGGERFDQGGGCAGALVVGVEGLGGRALFGAGVGEGRVAALALGGVEGVVWFGAESFFAVAVGTQDA